jgi:peptidoglycan/LPS O-acetylase OafA/YrhL
VILAVVIVMSPLMRGLLFSIYPDNWVAPYVLMPCRADALSIGVLIALGLREPHILSMMRQYSWAVYTLLAVWSVIGVRVLLGQFQSYEGKAFGVEYSFLASFYGLLLLATLLSERVSLVFSFRPLRFMGSIAYGVYLIHGLLSFLLRKLWFHVRPTSGAKSEIFVAAFSAAVSILIATASWKYFEKPLVQRGHRYKYAEELAAVA